MPSETRSLAYQEPDNVTLLVLTAFLLLLNVTYFFFDRVVCCGLLAQILIGVLFGAPGAQWLSDNVQLAVRQLGYLGLILIVYEGGLSTRLRLLQANLILSTLVAFTGIGLPLALSFVLRSLQNATTLESFAAGAALCSTSLGTTFTVLRTSGLIETRLGTVLSSAAIMDDVVGLVLVQVISSLGSSSSELSAVIVVRPILVSIAFAVVLPMVCTLIIAPSTRWLHTTGRKYQRAIKRCRIATREGAFVVQTLFLVGMVIGASYAGTSGLFAAYLTGAMMRWYGDLIESLQRSGDQRSDGSHSTPRVASQDTNTGEADSRAAVGTPSVAASEEQCSASTLSGLAIYEEFYSRPVKTILKPLFFASIGFSIPIGRMFAGAIVWRGIVYSMLMALGKLLCGAWLLRLRIPDNLALKVSSLQNSLKSPLKTCFPFFGTHAGLPKAGPEARATSSEPPCAQESKTTESTADEPANRTNPNKKKKKRSERAASLPSQPLSLYPSAVLGSAMVARGEIGFLISSVAQSRGLFTDETFLVVTWAIFLCTLIGPLCVGLLVGRLRRLQDGERNQRTGRQDPMGSWGVSAP